MNIKGIIADAIFQRLLRWHPWPYWIGLNVKWCLHTISTKEAIALLLYLWAMRNGQD